VQGWTYDGAAGDQTLMADPRDGGPPSVVTYGLGEALELLAALEDSRDALFDSDHLAVGVELEHQIAMLNRRLGFDDPQGDAGAR
jgi:hypothetical protein